MGDFDHAETDYLLPFARKYRSPSVHAAKAFGVTARVKSVAGGGRTSVAASRLDGVWGLSKPGAYATRLRSVAACGLTACGIVETGAYATRLRYSVASRLLRLVAWPPRPSLAPLPACGCLA